MKTVFTRLYLSFSTISRETCKIGKIHYNIISVRYCFLLCIIFNFLIKIRERHEKVRDVCAILIANRLTFCIIKKKNN